MKKITACNLCKSKDFSVALTDYDRANPIDTRYKLYKCNNCGLHFINPRLSVKELEKHYPTTYYAFSEEHSGFMEELASTYYTKKSVAKKIAYLPFKPLVRPFWPVNKGRVLDVGCGNGAYLATLAKNTNMDCYGVEPYPFDKRNMKKYGLKIFQGELKDAKYKDDFFDVVVIASVLEHVQDPMETLKEIHRVLKPGGYVVVHVPVIDCLAYKVFGKYWVHLDLPRHLHLFTRKTLRMYAKDAGFTVDAIKETSQPPYQFTGSVVFWQYRKKRYPKPIAMHPAVKSRLVFLATYPFTLLVNLFRQGDEVDVILRKN